MQQMEKAMSEFIIEKDVVMPPRKQSGGRHANYPFFEMAIGDSFLASEKKQQMKAALAAYTFGRKNNMRFATRKVEGGLRIWRIA